MARPISAKRNRIRSLEALERRCLLAADIVINEIHYDPPDKTEFSEFIELYNNSDVGVDVSNWSITDGVDYQIPVGVIVAANDYLVISQDPATVESVFDRIIRLHRNS